jgi:hypothetical protein
MKSIIDTYNNNSHRTLKNKTPNQVYKDNDDQTARHLNDTAHNQAIYKSVPFNDGEKVRILEQKEKFDKGKKKFCKEVYTINKKEGYKLLVNGTSRKLKPSELLKASTTANPIAEKYIQEKKEEKKKGKVINSLVRNAKMTPAEAKAAVAQLEQDEPKQKRAPKKREILDL